MAHKKNPKRHTVDEIIASIRRNGFKSPPMIDSTTMIMVAGHGRCEALAKMSESGEEPPEGIELDGEGAWTLPVLYSEFSSEANRDAYLVADNAISENGGYDKQALADMLSELGETEGGLDGTGYDDDDLNALLAEIDDVDEKDDEEDEDDEDDKPEPSRVDAGDSSGGTTVDVEGHTRTIGGHKLRPPAHMTNDDWTVINGDCLEGLRKLQDESIDAIVTDPPAGIAFMGRDWDTDKGGRDAWIAWLGEVMAECYRVLKPGGHGLAWALPRTSHWTATAIENAKFELRDRVSHLFITGFPKSLNIGKAIDAKLGATRQVTGRGVASCQWIDRGEECQGHETNTLNKSYHQFPTAPGSEQAAKWEGWGTALKPALEDWWLFRKPVAGTIAENVLNYGTGGINIDACRIGDEDTRSPTGKRPENGWGMSDGVMAGSKNGRWPTHLAVSDGVEINDIELPALYFYCPKPSKAETEAGLDDLPEQSSGELTRRKEGSEGLNNPRAGAGRGSSRRNTHPTKKPIALMRWLIRLITPPGGTVLDPFTGSGTTGLAAMVEGCQFLGFEQSTEFWTIACERLRTIIEHPELADDADEEPEPAASTAPVGNPPPPVANTGSIVESSVGDLVYVGDPDDHADDLEVAGPTPEDTTH